MTHDTRLPRKGPVLALVAVVFLVVAILFWWRVLWQVPEADRAHASTASAPASNEPLERLDAPRVESARTAANKENTPKEDDPAEDAPVEPSSPANGLWLRLIDESGQPKPGIELEIEQELWRMLGPDHPDKYVHEAHVTDSAGRVRVTAHDPREIEFVTLTKEDGTSLTASSPFALAPGQADEILLLYPETVTIRGRVLDLSGAPVKTSARVELEAGTVAPTASGAASFHTDENETAYVDAAGHFAFEKPAGWYALSAAEPGTPAAERVTLGITGAARSVDLDLFVVTSSRTVRVRLASTIEFEPSDAWVGATGAMDWPVARAIDGVSIERRRIPQVVHAPHANGAWILELPVGGAWKVRAGGVPFETTEVDLPPEAEEIVVTLEPRPRIPTCTLQGRVVDSTGAPLSATVALLRAEDLGQFMEARTDETGAFRFTLEPGLGDEAFAYVLAKAVRSGSQGLGPISCSRSRADLDITLGPALFVEGRVNGLPSGVDAEVLLRSQSSRFARDEMPSKLEWLPHELEGDRVITSDDGEFRFANLCSGEYELWAEPRDGTTPPARVRVRAGDRNVQVELGAGLEGGLTLHCRVVDDITGAPVVGAQVELHGEGIANRPRGSRGRTDAAGRCDLLGHAAGRFAVFARADGYAFPLERFVDYEKGDHVVELRLSPACTLDLQFRDATGSTCSRVEVCATTLAGELVDLQDLYGHDDGSITHSDLSGRAILAGLPAGRLRVVVGWRDGAPCDIEGADATLENTAKKHLVAFEHTLVPGVRSIVKRILP